MKSLSLCKAITVLAIFFMAVPVSAGRLNDKDTHCDTHVDILRGFKAELASVYYFAGSGELTSPLPAVCPDSPDGLTLKGEGAISQMFVTGLVQRSAPPTWTSEIEIQWENAISNFAGGLCAPVNGTITDTFPDGSTMTSQIVGLACAMDSSTEGVPSLPYICYLSAKVVEGTGLCEGAKGLAKITSSIDVDGKITMIGKGTLKLVADTVVE